MPGVNETKSGVKSKAAIGGHPIHPMLIPFPLAFLFSAPVTDLVYLATGDPFWARLSFWLLLAGVSTALLAAVFGFADFISIKAIRSLSAAWVHFVGNLVAVALAAVNVLLRWGAPPRAPEGLEILLSLGVALILVVTGWFGGELSYRHGVGVDMVEASEGAQVEKVGMRLSKEK